MTQIFLCPADPQPDHLPRGTRAFVRRVLLRFVGELRSILKRRAPAYYRRFPAAPRPCRTCAFNPSTDRMRGFEMTAKSMMESLRDERPFYCHANLPYTREDGWKIPVEQLGERWLTDLTRPCASWWIVKDDPAAAHAFETAARKTPPRKTQRTIRA